MYLNGDGIAGKDARGRTISDDHFLLYFNGGEKAVDVQLPAEEYAAAWDVVIDTAGRSADSEPKSAGDTFTLEGRSMLVLRAHTEPVVEPDHSVAASLAVRTGGQPPAAPSGTTTASGGAQAPKAKPSS
jgi:glycogen operon protein